MQLIIKFIGVAIIVQTCVFLLRIDLLRELLKFFARGNRIYFIAAIRIAVAVLLLIGATQCRRMWIIVAIGIVLLLSGIAIFTLNSATFKKILTWYQQRADLFLRLLAVIGIVFGSLIVYAA
ncbi:MAG: hypothetical protein Q7T18_09450 [Sedimentisphaerales bacterium]|nr:hypothetical protein [Sedimentisphaerales bacterium]